MTTRTTRRAPRAVTPTPADVPAVVPTIAVETIPADVPADIPADVPAVDPIAARIDAAFPGVAGGAMPMVRDYAAVFAAVATMPFATRDDRAAIHAAIVAAMDARHPGAVAGVARNTGRYHGAGIFDSQNAMYLAAAMSGVFVNNAMFVSAWRAEFPNAKCDYMGRAYDRGYPTSTLSDYVGNRHNTVPGIPGAHAAIAAWYTRGRKPE